MPQKYVYLVIEMLQVSEEDFEILKVISAHTSYQKAKDFLHNDLMERLSKDTHFKKKYKNHKWAINQKPLK